MDKKEHNIDKELLDLASKFYDKEDPYYNNEIYLKASNLFSKYTYQDMEVFASRFAKRIVVCTIEQIRRRILVLKVAKDSEGNKLYDEETIKNILKHIEHVKEYYN